MTELRGTTPTQTPLFTGLGDISRAVAQATAVVPPEAVRQLNIHLVSDAAATVCPFWVGLAAPGKLTPRELLDEPTTQSLLTAAAASGLSDPTPLMLTDTTHMPLRSILMMPLPKSDFRDRAQWVHDLAAALKPWGAKTVGFYLAPEVMELSTAYELLLGTLNSLLQSLAVESIYLLTGAHGINPILNAALRLKTELQSHELSLYVYH